MIIYLLYLIAVFLSTFIMIHPQQLDVTFQATRIKDKIDKLKNSISIYNGLTELEYKQVKELLLDIENSITMFYFNYKY